MGAKRARPEPTILEAVATALSWPPAEYSAAATWCPHCAYPLTRSVHHQNCIGYIVGHPDLPLCSCPCNGPRRLEAQQRKPDPVRDRPQWWLSLEIAPWLH